MSNEAELANEWIKARNELDRYESLHQAALKTWPNGHFMRKHTEQRLNEAKKKYDQVVSKL